MELDVKVSITLFIEISESKISLALKSSNASEPDIKSDKVKVPGK
jgi:hypothetical protein